MESPFTWCVVYIDNILICLLKKIWCIINAILLHWVGSGYGVIKCFNWHPRRVQCWWNQEVANKLYVGVYTTATHSPFQNGLCKYIYAVTNSMLTNHIS